MTFFKLTGVSQKCYENLLTWEEREVEDATCRSIDFLRRNLDILHGSFEPKEEVFLQMRALKLELRDEDDLPIPQEDKTTLKAMGAYPHGLPEPEMAPQPAAATAAAPQPSVEQVAMDRALEGKKVDVQERLEELDQKQPQKQPEQPKPLIKRVADLFSFRGQRQQQAPRDNEGL